MTETSTDTPQPQPQPPPSEQELRAAYEAELSRIASADLILQTAASLLNLGARRLGLTGEQPGAQTPRDLEQVRDAIDGVRALMPILERRFAQGGEIAPLRDALSQLQMAYAREAQRGVAEQTPDGESATEATPSQAGADAPPSGAEAQQSGHARPPGPAEASGRLWVPGR
ncbi:MAG TPA: hypothetical protein VNY33_06970 [Gaiellaceae bacterium]|jgi:hypothetical protein|nr:hypothetical protein [Gaiellaceae bacterium]